MRKVLLSLIFTALAGIFIPSVSQAQENEYFHCQQPQMRAKLLQEHPEILQQEEAMEEWTRDFIANYKKTHTEKSNQGLIVIPLVFHILNEGGAENISDAQVRDEVKIMNRDYNKRNADTSQAVGYFPNIIADMGVEWRLASIDPNGNCTNGIDRITSDQTNIGDDYSKLNGWDRTKYINVWVARTFNLTPGAAGYAYYPVDVQDQYSTPWRDGVILENNYIGSIGTGSVFTSRALTHEIGHCFNLEHCWGNTNNPGVACGDDGIQDTPITQGWQYCPSITEAKKCDTSIIENYQNYMEYSYCSVMFTQGQKARWIASANSPISGRNNLWSDSNLIATGTYDTFVSPCAPIANFSISNRYVCSGGKTTFLNSSGNADSMSYFWDFPNGDFVPPSTATDKNPTVQFNSIGWQTAKLTVTNAYGSSTRVDSTLLFVGYNIAQATAPYYEGFDDPNVFNENQWISVNYEAMNRYNDNITWFRQVNSTSHRGSGCALLNNYDAHANWDIDEMVSPGIDLTNLSPSEMTLSFYYSGATAKSSYSGLIDSMSLLASTNCGSSWHQIYKMGGAVENNAGYVTGRYQPTNADAYWQKVNVLLNNTTYNKPDVIFKWQVFTSVGGNNLYIDDINIGNYYTDINDISIISEANVFPNPSGGTSELSLVLATPGKVAVKVYNMEGQQVLNVFDGNLSDGETRLNIDGTSLASGVYIVNIRAGESVVQRKLVIK